MVKFVGEKFRGSRYDLAKTAREGEDLKVSDFPIKVWLRYLSKLTAALGYVRQSGNGMRGAADGLRMLWHIAIL